MNSRRNPSMISKSRALIKIIILLTITLAYLDESEAMAAGPSASPDSPPDYNHGQQYDYTPQYRKFLKACEKRMSNECSQEIFANVLKSKKMTHCCCSKLVYTGPDCHKAFIDREKDLMKNSTEKDMVVSKSDQVWNNCEKRAPESKDKNYPRFPAREYRPGYKQFLKGCEKKLTNKCGTQIMDAIFKKNKKVEDDCCSKLLQMGKECHDELLKRAEKDGQYEKNPRRVREKSEEVWKYCCGK